MNTFLYPTRLVARIKSKADPNVLRPVCSLLLRECLLDDDIAIVEEELGLFL